MTKKVICLTTAFALALCLCGTSVYARSKNNEPTEKPATTAEKNVANEKLKADVTKLVADARAGKLKMPTQTFPQPQRNNLSTGAKIGIIAGIAGAIVVIAILVKLNSD